jgi:hypothetical protein
MEAADIERYLAELGAEFKNRGLKKPVRILLARRGSMTPPIPSIDPGGIPGMRTIQRFESVFAT